MSPDDPVRVSSQKGAPERLVATHRPRTGEQGLDRGSGVELGRVLAATLSDQSFELLRYVDDPANDPAADEPDADDPTADADTDPAQADQQD